MDQSSSQSNFNETYETVITCQLLGFSTKFIYEAIAKDLSRGRPSRGPHPFFKPVLGAAVYR